MSLCWHVCHISHAAQDLDGLQKVNISLELIPCFNTLRPRQNGRHFPDDIFKCIFFSENVWISLKISLRFVPNGPINNIPALVQIMAWRQPSDKPLSEPMVVGLLMHICVTRPQWANTLRQSSYNFAGNILESISFCENCCNLIEIFHWNVLLRVYLTIKQHWFR